MFVKVFISQTYEYIFMKCTISQRYYYSGINRWLRSIKITRFICHKIYFIHKELYIENLSYFWKYQYWLKYFCEFAELSKFQNIYENYKFWKKKNYE